MGIRFPHTALLPRSRYNVLHAASVASRFPAARASVPIVLLMVDPVRFVCTQQRSSSSFLGLVLDQGLRFTTMPAPDSEPLTQSTVSAGPVPWLYQALAVQKDHSP